MVRRYYRRRRGSRKRFRRYMKRHGFKSRRPMRYSFTRTQMFEMDVRDWASYAAYCNSGTQYWFSLDQLTDATEFTYLFDQYRICGVQCKFIYSQNSGEQAAITSATTLPLLYTIVDQDDGTQCSPTYMMEYMTVRINRLDRIVKRYVRPRANITNPEGIGMATRGQWFDCDDSNVKYYGIKWDIDPMEYGTSENLIGKLRVYFKYYIQCRTVR